MRVFIDSSVLIVAARAQEDALSQQALAELDREDVEYLYSPIVELEVLPQPTVHKKEDEVNYYKTFFESATKIDCTAQVQQLALEEACKGVGLHAADALHVACAISGNADELVTAELKTKPLPQATGITVRTIRV